MCLLNIPDLIQLCCYKILHSSGRAFHYILEHGSGDFRHSFWVSLNANELLQECTLWMTYKMNAGMKKIRRKFPKLYFYIYAGIHLTLHNTPHPTNNTQWHVHSHPITDYANLLPCYTHINKLWTRSHLHSKRSECSTWFYHPWLPMLCYSGFDCFLFLCSFDLALDMLPFAHHLTFWLPLTLPLIYVLDLFPWIVNSITKLHLHLNQNCILTESGRQQSPRSKTQTSARMNDWT